MWEKGDKGLTLAICFQHQKVCLLSKHVDWLSLVSLEYCRSAKVVKLSSGRCVKFRMFFG